MSARDPVLDCLYRERDSRHTRIVRVIYLGNEDWVMVRTVSVNGDESKGGRATRVWRSRFAKAFEPLPAGGAN